MPNGIPSHEQAEHWIESREATPSNPALARQMSIVRMYVGACFHDTKLPATIRSHAGELAVLFDNAVTQACAVDLAGTSDATMLAEATDDQRVQEVFGELQRFALRVSADRSTPHAQRKRSLYERTLLPSEN